MAKVKDELQSPAVRPLLVPLFEALIQYLKAVVRLDGGKVSFERTAVIKSRDAISPSPAIPSFTTTTPAA